ncbi:unnamed protein product [Protopolystoma xenopodis]|uniref:C2H2-type domain-containing protein n=1 Tax=Protopolystoma xenopodis TaxID=117903 RepID=A0A3S5CPL3_9PLAT|nr:unnamed protein product [Protopolystoma xenopodis]
MFACLICDARLTDFDCLLGHLVLVHGQTSAPCATPHCPLCGRACPAGLAALRQHVTVTHLTNVGQIGRGQVSLLNIVKSRFNK